MLTALADALSDDDVPHAAVEAEALRWAHPGLTDEQQMRHVKAVCVLSLASLSYATPSAPTSPSSCD